MVKGIRKDNGELLQSNRVQLFDGVDWVEVEPDSVTKEAGGKPKERAMWLPYYNGGLDRREYRCSKCWNRTTNKQDPRCLDCGSDMLREM